MDVPANAFLADPQLQAWATEYANEFGIPVSMVINALVRETGTSIAPNGGVVLDRNIQTGVPEVRGNIAQLHSNTWPHITDRAGNRVVTDPTNDQQAIRGLAAALFTTGTGGFFDATRGSVQGPYGWDPIAALIGYNSTWSRARDYLDRSVSGGNPTAGLPDETIRYVGQVGQGLTNIPIGFQVGGGLINDPTRQQQLLDQLVRQYGSQDFSSPIWHEGGGIGSDIRFPIGPETGIPDVYINEGINQTDLGGGTAVGPNQDFLNDVEARSAAAGYELPAGVAEFLQRTAPSLAAGPEGFAAGNFPWFTPGAIGEDIGGILQHHALMPNNLVYNPETQLWDVPNERRFPSNTGIWGAEQVASLLPDLGEGFQRDYLTHLGYGARQEHNYGGLSNAYWGTPNLYGAPSSGQLGNWFGQTTSGYPWGTSGMGNQGFGNIADMTNYNQPFDYTAYFGALGGQNPTVSAANPPLSPGGESPDAFEPGGAGYTGYVSPNSSGYFGGYPQYASGATYPYGIVSIYDPGPNVSQQIDTTAAQQAAFNAAQVAAANQQQATHNQTMLNQATAGPWTGWTPGFGLLY